MSPLAWYMWALSWKRCVATSLQRKQSCQPHRNDAAHRQEGKIHRLPSNWDLTKGTVASAVSLTKHLKHSEVCVRFLDSLKINVFTSRLLTGSFSLSSSQGGRPMAQGRESVRKQVPPVPDTCKVAAAGLKTWLSNQNLLSCDSLIATTLNRGLATLWIRAFGANWLLQALLL